MMEELGYYNSLAAWLCVQLAYREKRKNQGTAAGLVSYGRSRNWSGKSEGTKWRWSAPHLAGWPLGTWPHAFLPCADRSDWDWDWDGIPILHIIDYHQSHHETRD